VTVEPATGSLYFSGLLAALNSMLMYQVPMTGRNAGMPTRITWTQATGAIEDALIVPNGILFAVRGTATSSGLWSGPLAGGPAVQLGAVADPAEVAADTRWAYVLTHKAGTPSTIWRYDFQSPGFTQVVTGLPEAKAFDVFPPGSQRLLVGARDGDL
jgi:hypothetical protein